MKIESIHLENFGIYGSKRFRFDSQPLVLIYGANESGKTTALNGLRQALFGFPRNSAYITGKTMSAEGHVTLADGRRIRFNRQKKNNDGFTATIDGKVPLTESEWNQLASGLDLKAYQSLFGFSLDELRSGEKALAHAPIEQALSASGFGGLARLQAVQNRIEEYLNSSLKRAGTSGTINANLAEIEAAEQHLESVLTLPNDVAQLRQQVSEAQQRVAQQQTQLHQLRQQLQAAQRQQAALPACTQYQQVLQSLSQFNIPEQLDTEFRLEWTVLSNRLAGLRSELSSETRKLDQLRCELDSLPTAQDAAVHQTEAISLGKQAREVPSWRSQLDDSTSEIAELERELGDTLRKLGWTSQDSRWRSLNLDLNQQAELDAARDGLEKITTQLSQCITRIDMAEKQLHMHRQPQTETATAALSWDQVLEVENQLRALRPLAHDLDQHRKELARLRSDARFKQLNETLQNKLTSWSSEFSADSLVLCTGWPVPAIATARQSQSQLQQAASTVQRLEQALGQLQAQRDALQADITQSQSKAGVKTLAELEAIWCQRDQIVTHWHEELSTPLLASTVSPTEHNERLTQLRRLNQQSDSAVRAMLAAVEQVAVVAAKERQLAAIDSTIAGATNEVEQAQQALQDCQATWLKLWAGCPLSTCAVEKSSDTPQTAELIEWLELYCQWEHLQTTIEQKNTELQAAEAAYGQARAALCQLWPEIDNCASLGQAEQLVARLRSQLSASEAQVSMLRGLEQSYSSSLNQRGELERQLEKQRHSVQQVLVTVGLPESWPFTEVTARMESLRRCQSLGSRLDALRKRTSEIQQKLNSFAGAAAELGKKLGIAELSLAPEAHAQIWMDQFLHREQADHRRVELAGQIDNQHAQCTKRSEQIGHLESEQQRLVARITGQSVEQVQGWIQQAATVIQLRARQAELTAALESNAGGRPLPEFLEELSALHPRTVAANVSTLNAQVSSLDADLTTAQQEVGGMARELEFKEQGSAALEAEQRLKRLRAELVELSERWSVHKLAGELLARTIDRFTRDHEPQLLKHTRRFFKELTDDRYGMVEHDSGKHGGFAVRDQHGHAWQPDKLSTGTREQLYLAIRLAFITHFNETHEPLPVIMDDCFVNFDDTRARIALRTLIHWQESVQTILLSCHWRSVEALAELAPETPVLDIATSQVASARSLARRAAPENESSARPLLPLR